MGSYVFGIVLSIVMIAIGISQISGASNLLLIFGIIFLIIDVIIFIRAKKRGDF